MFQYNHNEHYADVLLRHVPPHCHNALDIGCGDGDFARRLADQFAIAVTGIDPNRAMIERAQAETLNPKVRFVEADFMHYDGDDRFDLITATASLHHMPFEPVLEKIASLLRPGGVLAVLGCFREVGLADMGVALVASPVNVFYGPQSWLVFQWSTNEASGDVPARNPRKRFFPLAQCTLPSSLALALSADLAEATRTPSFLSVLMVVLHLMRNQLTACW